MGEEPAAAALTRRHTVLCVDDEPPVLNALHRLLRGQPYELLSTHDPGQALAWAGSRDPSLVIADYRMPAMDGIELLERVRERRIAALSAVLLVKPWDSDSSWRNCGGASPTARRRPAGDRRGEARARRGREARALRVNLGREPRFKRTCISSCHVP